MFVNVLKFKSCFFIVFLTDKKVKNKRERERNSRLEHGIEGGGGVWLMHETGSRTGGGRG